MDGFDIYDAYIRILSQGECSLPPRLAAVQALIQALSHHNPHTLSETLSLLSQQSSALKNAAAHSVDPITLSAGLDTFQRHLVTSLARPDREQSRDDDKTQQAVLKAGEDFVISGLQERRKVKLFGRKFIRDGTTIVVPGDTGIGSSENVQGFLEEATGITRIFRIIEVIDGLDALKNNVGAEQRRSTLQRRFHEEEIPHMRITSSSLASTLSRIPTTVPAIATEFTPSQNILLTGAAAILASGGALVEECAKNAACVARAMGYQVWIVAEAGKAVREMDVSTAMDRHTPFQRWNEEPRESQKDASRRLDVLLPDFITGIITQKGPQSTEAVAEEAIRLWF